MRGFFFKTPDTMPGEFLELDAGCDGLTFRKELIYEGDFVKKTKDCEQPFTVDKKKLAHWCHQGNRMIDNGVAVPVPIKHTDNPEARRATAVRYELGWNKNRKAALFGVMRFRDAQAAQLAASTDVSIFVPAESFTDGLGNEYPYSIKHIALTDYPVIPGLEGFEAIAASYDDQLELSDMGTLTGNHLGDAAVHGGLGYLEYKHGSHLVKKLGGFAKRQFGKGGVKRTFKALRRVKHVPLAPATTVLGKVGVGAAKIARGSIGRGGPLLGAAVGGAIAAHGIYHGIKGASSSLKKGVKAAKVPTALSLSKGFGGKGSTRVDEFAGDAVKRLKKAHSNARAYRGGDTSNHIQRRLMRRGLQTKLTQKYKFGQALRKVAPGAAIGGAGLLGAVAIHHAFRKKPTALSLSLTSSVVKMGGRIGLAAIKRPVVTGATVAGTYGAVRASDKIKQTRATGQLKVGKVSIGMQQPKKFKPRAVTLSLNFNSHEPRAKDGKWRAIGRKAAGVAVASAGASRIAVHGLSAPIGLAAIRHATRRAGGIPQTLTRAHKAGIAADALGNIAHGGVLIAVGRRITRKPSDHVADQSRTVHGSKAAGNAYVAAALGGHSVASGLNAVKHAHTASKVGKTVEQMYRHGGAKGSQTLRAVGHLAGTRGAVALAGLAAAGSAGAAYGAHRAYRKAGMHVDKALSLESEYHAENHRPNIYGRIGGRFAHKPHGTMSTRELKSFHGLSTQTHSIRDKSREDVHSGDRLTHSLQALKHISLGAIEGGLVGGALWGVAHSIKKSGKGILAIKPRSRTAAKTAHKHLLGISKEAAAAAAASGIFATRLHAIHHHAKGALGYHR